MESTIACKLVAGLKNPNKRYLGPWHLRFVNTGNNETLFSSESYVSKGNAKRAASKLGFTPVESE